MGKQSWRGGNMLYPVPAVMVSCARPGEKPNIITVAWAGTVCSAPAMLSISVRKERYSYNIIKETGEFVVNLVTKDLVFATDYCGVKSGRDTDKFQEMKLISYSHGTYFELGEKIGTFGYSVRKDSKKTGNGKLAGRMNDKKNQKDSSKPSETAKHTRRKAK